MNALLAWQKAAYNNKLLWGVSVWPTHRPVSAQCFEEINQQGAGVVFAHAVVNFWPVVDGWLLEQSGAMQDAAALRVICREIQSP